MSQLWIVDTIEGDAEYTVWPNVVTERGDDVPVSSKFATELRERVCTLHVFDFDANNNLVSSKHYSGAEARVLYNMRYFGK